MWRGHHAIYFKTVLKILSNRGYFVYASCADNQSLQDYIEKENIGNCQVMEARLNIREKILFRFLCLLDLFLEYGRYKSWCQFRSLAGLMLTKAVMNRIKERDLIVFFPSLDTVCPLLPTWISKYFFPERWTGIRVTPPYKSEAFFGKFRKRQQAYVDKAFKLDSCLGVFVIHPVYKNFYRKFLKRDKFHPIPEPISLQQKDFSEVVQLIKSQAGGRKIILMVGDIIKKKNFPLFLEIAKRMPADQFFFVVIGTFFKEAYSNDELQMIQNALEAIKHNSFIKFESYIQEEAEFNALVNCCDCLYLHYRNHPFSSNQLLKAIAFRKLVLVKNGHLMETIVRENHWALAVDEDPDKIAAELQFALQHFQIDEEAFQKYSHYLSTRRLETVLGIVFPVSQQKRKIPSAVI